MKLYRWADMGGEGQDFEGHHFKAIEPARRALKAYLKVGYEGEFTGGTPIKEIAIERLDVGPATPDLVLRILNEQGYVNAREVVETWGTLACGACDFCEDEQTHQCQSKRIYKK